MDLCISGEVLAASNFTPCLGQCPAHPRPSSLVSLQPLHGVVRDIMRLVFKIATPTPLLTAGPVAAPPESRPSCQSRPQPPPSKLPISWFLLEWAACSRRRLGSSWGYAPPRSQRPVIARSVGFHPN